jgi:hypothetical protein
MHSFMFVTAAWMAGAPLDPPVRSPVPATPPAVVPWGSLAPAQRPMGQSPYHAIRHPPPGHIPFPAAQPTAAPVHPAWALPAPGAPPTAEVIPTSAAPVAEVRRDPQELVGHELDYSSITGYLYYVRTDGGRWVLRYARLDQVDRFGGSVVLAPAVEMRNYREGDLVTVHGEILDEGRACRSLGGARYRVNSIVMVERGSPLRSGE